MGQDALHLSALKESLLGAEWSADVELAPLPQQEIQNNIKQHIWFIFWPSSHFRKFHIVSPFLFLIRPDSSLNCRSRLSAPLLDNGPGVHESFLWERLQWASRMYQDEVWPLTVKFAVHFPRYCRKGIPNKLFQCHLLLLCYSLFAEMGTSFSARGPKRAILPAA